MSPRNVMPHPDGQANDSGLDTGYTYDPSDGLGLTAANAGTGSGGTVNIASANASAPAPTLVTTAGSALQFNLIWDSSVSSAPAGFMADVIAMAQTFETAFGNAATINIAVGYGEIGGSALSRGALGESEDIEQSVSYAALLGALATHNNNATVAAVLASLPSTSPVSGTIVVTTAQAKALGLIAGSGTAVDGNIGFATASTFTYSGGVANGTYDFNGVVAHEISEVMGRLLFTGGYSSSYRNAYSLLDLVHYSAPGVRDFSGSTPGYFSPNGGVTDGGDFNTDPSGDSGDWASSMGNNAFDAFSSSGVLNSFTSGDIVEMNAIGWTITPFVIESANGTSLVRVGSQYAMWNAANTGPTLEYLNNPVTVGEFGTSIAPIAAVKTANGYEVAWNLGSGLFVIWNTDSNGNYTASPAGVVLGSSYSLESAETTFGFDLNGDGTIGLKLATIANNGTTALVQAADEYEMNPSAGGTGPILQFQNTPITAGQFGASIAPFGAIKTATGYEVAWSFGGGVFSIWNTDSSGNYTSNAAAFVLGGSYPLEAAETTFHQDLNGDGTIGLKLTTIANNGTTALVQAANEYEMNPSAGGTGPILQYQNTPIIAGQFGASIAPVGAIKTATGYEVAWSFGGGVFTIWNTDSNGNYTSNATAFVLGGSYPLEAAETTFNQDLNGDSTIGPTTATIMSNSVMRLVRLANQYALENSSGSIVAWLSYQGTPVITGQFGTAVAPVGAKQMASGYEVAWSLGNSQFAVWNTDSTGNFTAAATGILSGTSTTLEALEANFANGVFAGAGPAATATTKATNGTTVLAQVGNLYELNPASGGTGPLLEYLGSYVAAGQFGSAVVPVGAVKTAAGYEVAWNLGNNQFAVWNTDSNGNYTGAATAVVTGQSFVLEDLEPTFGEDLNGDARLSAQLITTGTTVNLVSQTQSTTINLGANTASASAGLSAPSLAFLGTPDTITLGTHAAIVEYALQPSSGIETVAGFILGTDELNIDLVGAASSTLKAFDTTVNGSAAIALASTNDSLHGLVLTNVTGGLNAATLLTSHTTFVGGHALIS